jgi:predicted negative regulator of RcsB-dependent stress response
MTTTSRPETVPSAPDRRQTFIDWVQINSRWLTIGAAIVATAAVLFWFYVQLQRNRAERADSVLATAKQSLNANNVALAQTDLQRVVNSYGNTAPGVEAALLLATLQYDQGKYQEGINALEAAARKGAADESQVSIQSLIGDGYAQMKKLPEAAAAYERAAAAAHPKAQRIERAYQLAKAARTYSAAGKIDDAKRIWAELESSDVEAMAAEAKVRMAELNAASPGKS